MPVKHIIVVPMPRNQHNSNPSELPTIRGIIRAARGARTQEAYAAELGIRQDLLCKYEKGRVNPPASIVERCMRDVHTLSQRHTPSADMIAKRVRTDLAAPELEPIRAAIANLLDVLSTSRRRQTAHRQPA